MKHSETKPQAGEDGRAEARKGRSEGLGALPGGDLSNDWPEVILMARAWFEGDSEAALAELEHRAHAACAARNPDGVQACDLTDAQIMAVWESPGPWSNDEMDPVAFARALFAAARGVQAAPSTPCTWPHCTCTGQGCEKTTPRVTLPQDKTSGFVPCEGCDEPEACEIVNRCLELERRP